MRKRIRLHQLRVGMFVEEIEIPLNLPRARFRPFLVSSPSEIQRLMRRNIMSVIIDLTKGADVKTMSSTAKTFETDLNAKFSQEAIDDAKRSIDETRPQLRQVLDEARINNTFAADAAKAAVERIMASAMDNAGALIALSKLKNRDEGTYLHSFAVSTLMITFGRGMGLHTDNARLLGLGGLVHDLGKLLLPRAILMKPGKLSEAEMSIVRTHPQRGYQLLSRLEGTPQEVLDICLYHHEKFDGTGYPHRLSGKKIPYFARLAAICDVYDALTTIRPYKRAFSQAEAVNLMMNSPGHFDPELLSGFVSKMVINGTIM